MKQQKHAPAKSVIYCRVSSDRQVREGDGLNSQEKSCREFLTQKGYPAAIRVFKDKAVSGSLLPDNRPAAQELLAFLDTQKERFYVVIDDISRLARDMEAFIRFSTQISTRGAVLISPQQSFGTSSNEKLVTNVLMSVCTFQRDANAEQVVNRQRARLLNGYWVFHAPQGYRYVDAPTGGKILVREELKANIIAEAFEGFACGKFGSQAEVTNFLNKSGAFARKLYPTQVKGLLTCILYTGKLAFPAWEIPPSPGKHSAIVDVHVFEKVQERLGLKARAPHRKDIRSDFPLRGFVLCCECSAPLTAGWSTARDGTKHPYYHCKTSKCAFYGKTIRRDLIEGQFEDVLKQMQPSDILLNLTREIVADRWKDKKRSHANTLASLDRQKKQIDLERDKFIGRLLEVTDRTLIRVYEEQIKQLELKRQLVAAKVTKVYSADTSFEGAVGTAFDFIQKPYSLWANGDLEDKRLVLNLAFAKKIPFSKKEGFGTAAMSLPFSVMGTLQGSKAKMVEEAGFEPANS